MSSGWRRGQWVFVVCMLVVGCSTNQGVVARDATAITTVEDQAIPIDPGVRIITLKNGLTVYLRANDRPGGSVEMRLAIDAGSGQEDPDQIGVAHFLEHMMFNGTAKFPANELVTTLRGFGMEFGADVNASTSYDETVYELSVPTDASTNVATALDVLREWLSAATLDPTEVDKEKGVVLDEWRQAEQTFNGRVGTATEAMMLTGSGYEHHTPIGTDAAINAMTPELLRRFYDTWYRPDNAAIMIVGDIDVDDIEAKVRQQFEDLAARGTSVARTDPSLPAYNTADATVLADPDATTGDVQIMLPHPFAATDTVTSLRRDTLLALAFDMISTRLSDDVARGKAPFTSASVDNNGVVRWLDAPVLSVSGEPGDVSAALDAATAEIERAHRFGFDAAELDRVLRSYRSASQARLDSSDTTQDVEYITSYLGNYLADLPIPGADTEFQIIGSIYDEVTPEAVGSVFNDLLAQAAPHVLVVAPESAGAPTRDEVLARLEALPTLDLTPREQSSSGATELMSPPDPVQETATKLLDGDGDLVAPTMVTFPNGARVVLNHTDITSNDIYFAATSPGGLSLVDDADVPDALAAASVVSSSGIGDLDPVALDTLLSDAQVELYPSINQTSEDFTGSSTNDDLELLFQLLHLYFSKPRFDPAALDSTVSAARPYVADPTSDPDLAAYIAYAEARYGPEPRFEGIPTPAELESIDLAGVERVWRQRFANPGDWVFALVGDFDLDDARMLAREYIGTLEPGTTTHETYKDFQQDPPTTVINKEVHAGTGDTASVTFDWSVTTFDSDTESVYADVLTSVLNTLLTDHIREELGESYSPSATVAVNLEPDHLVETYLNVTGDPSKIPDIATIVLDDVTKLRQEGPTPAEFEAAIAEVGDTYQYTDNVSIGDILARAPDHRELIKRYADEANVLHDVTPSVLQQFITDVMPLDRYIEVQTLPA